MRARTPKVLFSRHLQALIHWCKNTYSGNISIHTRCMQYACVHVYICACSMPTCTLYSVLFEQLLMHFVLKRLSCTAWLAEHGDIPDKWGKKLECFQDLLQVALCGPVAQVSITHVKLIQNVGLRCLLLFLFISVTRLPLKIQSLPFILIYLLRKDGCASTPPTHPPPHRHWHTGFAVSARLQITLQAYCNESIPGMPGIYIIWMDLRDRGSETDGEWESYR